MEKEKHLMEDKLQYIIDHYHTLEKENPNKLSKLLSDFASELLEKGYRTSFIYKWMETALKHDPENIEAKQFIQKNNWQSKRAIIQMLDFPPLRESDFRATKRATIQQYQQICSQFLEEIDEQMDDELSAAYHLQIADDKEDHPAEQIQETLNQLIRTVHEIKQLAEEYEESSGDQFHNSGVFRKIQTLVAELEDYKEKWTAFFSEDSAEDEKKSALDELQEMIGLQDLKERIKKFYGYLKYQKDRKEKGFKTVDELSLNMVLLGNPGTGKTTIARTLAKIYYELGVLPREEVIETNRSQLVGSYIGQTEENVRSIVQKAMGGVLFIDEAYSLKREGQSGNDYGQTAIDTLVSLMTDKEYGGKFSVILAGYPEEMRQFLNANPGLRSRFPQSNIFELPDYSLEELLAIGDKMAKDNDFIITKAGKRELAYRIERERVDASFGNARTVQDIILQAIFHKGANVGEDADLFSYTVLDKDDFLIEKPSIESRPPMQRLNELVGLNEIKEAIKTYISFIKVQKQRRDKGLPSVPIQLHSVFTGNPGTGKTTVAKIYSELLKEIGILKRGHLIVAGRADLIAGYVGQTALKTRKKIREALGGVLFIDEAYSLFRDQGNDFGKEAVDTIVEEMTKHGENLVIILAGYPKEMELLLESNPGLKSRFKKFFHFPDYSAEELLEIMKLYVSKYNYELEDEALEFILKEMRRNPPKGNGRFAENIIHEAIQQQSLRLMEENTDWENNGVNIITLSDIQKSLEILQKGE